MVNRRSLSNRKIGKSSLSLPPKAIKTPAALLGYFILMDLAQFINVLTWLSVPTGDNLENREDYSSPLPRFL